MKKMKNSNDIHKERSRKKTKNERIDHHFDGADKGKM